MHTAMYSSVQGTHIMMQPLLCCSSRQTWIMTERNSSRICSAELSSGDGPGEAIGFSHIMCPPPRYHHWLVSQLLCQLPVRCVRQHDLQSSWSMLGAGWALQIRHDGEDFDQHPGALKLLQVAMLTHILHGTIPLLGLCNGTRSFDKQNKHCHDAHTFTGMSKSTVLHWKTAAGIAWAMRLA